MIGYCKTCRVTQIVQVWVPEMPVICTFCSTDLFNLSQEIVTLSQPAVSCFEDNHESLETVSGSFQPLLPKIYQSKVVETQLLECEDRLKYNPKDSDALLFLGKWSKSKGQLKLALDYFLRLVQSNPNHFEGLRHLSDLYLDQDNFEEAVTIMERIRTLKGDEDMVLYNLGIAYLHQKNVKKSVHFFSSLKYRTKDLTLKRKVEKILNLFDS